MGYREIYESWLNNPYFDEATRAELQAIAGNEKEIEERFYMDLEFGTAGLRGVIGAGTNRMNIYTVRKATQGLANYICKVGAQAKGVAIAYDSRHMSPEFADEAALCLAANGIKAYVFESLRPTPELSYASVKTMPLEKAKADGLYQTIGADIDDPYIAELKKLVLHQDCIDKVASELKIVYTPLHGTGNLPVRRVLKELGFTNVYVVPEQELPDGDFPTVSYPNPEAAEAFALGLALGKKVDADLILATDPDADRLGVYVKDAQTGEYHSLTGNMSGCLIGDYVIGQRKELFGLPEDGAFIRSIVSTNMADAIAAYYGIDLIEVLTGFKFIGQKILEFEETGKGTYLFGMEESYGCLPGTYARDKDAVAASMMLCEAAAYYKTKNMTLWDAMLAMYERYGYYKDDVTSITLKGIEGLAKIQEIMNTLRENAPAEIGGYKVTAVRDYKLDTITDTAAGAVRPTGLPKSNVLYYEMTDGAWVCVRPSGTEPKVKFYLGVKGTSLADADAKSEALSKAVHALIDTMM